MSGPMKTVLIYFAAALADLLDDDRRANASRAAGEAAARFTAATMTNQVLTVYAGLAPR